MTRFEDKYKSEVIDGLMKRFNYPNRMMVPRVSKIVINMVV